MAKNILIIEDDKSVAQLVSTYFLSFIVSIDRGQEINRLVY